MGSVLAERLAIVHLLADPLLQPLLVSDDSEVQQDANAEIGSGGQVRLSLAVRETGVGAHRRGASSWSTERGALCQVVLDQFIQTCGDKPLSDYNKSDGRKFVALQQQLPPNLSKQRGLLDASGGDITMVAAAAAKRGLAPQNDRTVNKKIGIVDQCFRWISAHYDECGTSPVAGMKLRIRQSAKDEREPFTCDQLNAIFDAPVYSGCHSELHWGRRGSRILRKSAKYWIPLIALFSGMRLNEICQLTRNHIREHNGTSYFALTADLRLKHPASIRSVPIHRALIDLGFLAFVQSRTDRLFPALKAHASGRLSDGFGKHFARFLESAGIDGDKSQLSLVQTQLFGSCGRVRCRFFHSRAHYGTCPCRAGGSLRGQI